MAGSSSIDRRGSKSGYRDKGAGERERERDRDSSRDGSASPERKKIKESNGSGKRRRDRDRSPKRKDRDRERRDKSPRRSKRSKSPPVRRKGGSSSPQLKSSKRSKRSPSPRLVILAKIKSRGLDSRDGSRDRERRGKSPERQPLKSTTRRRSSSDSSPSPVSSHRHNKRPRSEPDDRPQSRRPSSRPPSPSPDSDSDRRSLSASPLLSPLKTPPPPPPSLLLEPDLALSAKRRNKKDRWASSDSDGSDQEDGTPPPPPPGGPPALSATADAIVAAESADDEEGEILEDGELSVAGTKPEPPTPVGAGATAGGGEGAGTPSTPSIRRADDGGDASDVGDVEGAAGKLSAAALELRLAMSRGGGSKPTDTSSPMPHSSIPTVPTAPAVLDNHNPLLMGCRSVECYDRVKYINEGAYGLVFQAKNKNTGQIVAIKQVKMTKDAEKDGFPITALRETNVLLALHHPNIVRVHEMVTGSSLDKIYMVMEYFDADLKSVISAMKKRGEQFTTAEVKCLVQQLLLAVEYLHRHWYIHRDLKTSNLLYNAHGKLALCDFGLARRYEDPIRPYTPLVVTLWYRPPELLLGEKLYSTAVDMWSVGCIFGELVLGEPMFQGTKELEQLGKIFARLGSPTEERWPGYSELSGNKSMKWKAEPKNKLAELFPTTSFSGGPSLSQTGLDLLSKLLQLDPSQRPSAKEALEHPYFSEFPPPTPLEKMPEPHPDASIH